MCCAARSRPTLHPNPDTPNPTQEFIRQLDTGFLQNRAARKLTNDAGEEVVRCRCSGSFGRQMLLVPVKSTLARLNQQVCDEVSLGMPEGADPQMELAFQDTDLETLPLHSDAALRSAIADARARTDETLSLQVVTRLDRERAAAEEAAAAAQKEREEAEAAEAAARRELEEAEEAERQALEARAAAMAAKASHSKEELEAEEAERHAEDARAAGQVALAGAAEAAKQVAHLEALLAAAAGDQAQVDEAAAQLAAAREAETAAKQAAELAVREHAAAVEDAERERREADEARKALEAERSRAEEMERVAAKERAEAEEAQRAALKERAEYEAAHQHLERSQAELQRTLDSMAEGQEGSVEGSAAQLAAEDAGREQEERQRQQVEEHARRRQLNASETIVLNFRVYRARKQLRYRKNVRRMQERRAAATCIQHTVREWIKSRQLRQLARRKVLAMKSAQAVLLQGAVRMWMARGALHQQRLECSRAGLFLGRYRLSAEPASTEQGAAAAAAAAGPPGPPGGGMEGLPEVGVGAVGLQRRVQERQLIAAINWRFMGEHPPPLSPGSVQRLPSSALSRLPSGGDSVRPVLQDIPELSKQRACHPTLVGSEHKEWVMWGEDEKRPEGHSLRRVMLRFSVSGERHKGEVRRLRALAGEDAAGRHWRSCSSRELLPSDMHAVSVVLDASMFIPGPGLHVLVQPAPLMLLSTQLAQLASRGLSRELVNVLENLTAAVDLVHSRNLVMLGSLNDRAFGFLDGRWILHDLADLQERGHVLTARTWNAAAVPAPEAQALALGIEDELQAHPAIDMFLLGLILFQVFVGRPLAPDPEKLLLFLQRMREEGTEADLLIGTGRCPDQVGKYILENTLALDPEERFSAKEALIHLAQMCQPATSLQELTQPPKWQRERMSSLPPPPAPSITGPAYPQPPATAQAADKPPRDAKPGHARRPPIGAATASGFPAQAAEAEAPSTGEEAAREDAAGAGAVEKAQKTAEEKEATERAILAASKMSACMADLHLAADDSSPWSQHAPVYKLASVAKETSMEVLGEDEEEEGEWDDEGTGQDGQGQELPMGGLEVARREEDQGRQGADYAAVPSAEEVNGLEGKSSGEEGARGAQAGTSSEDGETESLLLLEAAGAAAQFDVAARAETANAAAHAGADVAQHPGGGAEAEGGGAVEAPAIRPTSGESRQGHEDCARRSLDAEPLESDETEQEAERRREQEQMVMARSRPASRAGSSRPGSRAGKPAQAADDEDAERLREQEQLLMARSRVASSAAQG